MRGGPGRHRGEWRRERPLQHGEGPMTRIVIIGGGPAGYEAALVAAQLGADVTVVERDGSAAPACSPTACRPRPSSPPRCHDRVTATPPSSASGPPSCPPSASTRRGQRPGQGAGPGPVRRHPRPAGQGEGVRVRRRHGPARRRLRGLAATGSRSLDADGAVAEDARGDVVLLATGADPRVLPGAEPDGERILDWRQVYDLDELPEHLVVVGSGVTGAEFASAYLEAGVQVTLVSSRERVLPGEDADAAAVRRAGLPAPRRPIPSGAGPPPSAHRRGRRRRAHRRAHRRGLARADDGRHRPQHRRAGPREYGVKVTDGGTSSSTGSRAPVPGHLRGR